VSGEPAPNYRVAGVELDPPRVKVVGAQPEVLRLNEVLTETIDVTGATSDVVKEVSVALGGRNLWLEETKPVMARVRIEPVQGTHETPAGAQEGQTG
jgi:YbbR domain-containing protein